LPSDETAALLAALPALEQLRELEDVSELEEVQRARTTRLHDNKHGDEMADQNPFVDPLPLPAVGAATAVVLVGIDGSESSWDALSWGCGEARRLRGRAVAVFVSSSADSAIPVSAFIGAFPFDCGWNEPTATERAEMLGREVECYADQIVVGRSVKARHHLVGSLGCRLASKRQAPVVVVVP
jgi:hypothetical protein